MSQMETQVQDGRNGRLDWKDCLWGWASETKNKNEHFCYNTLAHRCLENTGEDNDYETAIDKLSEYFSPQTNIAYEVYNFRQAKQKEGKSLDSYSTIRV